MIQGRRHLGKLLSQQNRRVCLAVLHMTMLSVGEGDLVMLDE